MTNSPDDLKQSTSLSELRIGRELADTTWRILVPVVVFAGTGLFADRSIGSAPWLTLAGMAIGFAAAAFLIKRQLDRWPMRPVRSGSYERNRRPGDDEEKKDYYDD